MYGEVVKVSYWDSVPIGTWTIIDTEDCLEALKDPESRASFYADPPRINVFGPARKALIIDLKAIKNLMDEEDFINFEKSLLNILNIDNRVVTKH